MAEARNARAEADAVVGEGFSARVLEPSPPAIHDDYKADDPVARDAAGEGVRVVSPSGTGDLTWAEWLEDHPGHGDWAADRWLANYRRLPASLPEGYTQARERLHLLATNVLTPARYRANGKIGLRYTFRGFGTPFFGDNQQVRVQGTDLVVEGGGGAASEPLSTLGAACRMVLGQDGPDLKWASDLKLHDVPPTGSPDDDISVPDPCAALLADWFGFAYTVLEQLRAEGHDASRPQIWPEHFDPAIEVHPDKLRGSYGFSPGDGSSEQPYVYVSLWYKDEVASKDDPRWNASSFPGAIMGLDEIGAHQGDQVAFVLDWLRERRDLAAAKA